MTPGNPRTAGTSIRATWTRVLAGLCAVVLTLGAISLGLAVIQRSMFERVTSQYHGEVGTVVDLAQVLQTAEAPLGVILYRLGSADDRRSAAETFERVDGEATAAFQAARQATATGGDVSHLDDALESWQVVVGAVADARTRWGSPAVGEALAEGEDPYRYAWEALTEAQSSLNAFTATSVERLREDTDRTDAQLRILLPALAGAVLLALLLAVGAARRLTRRVISPVLAITATARRMKDGDLTTRVEVESGAGELAELAEAVNSLAESLEVSHAELHVQATTDPLTGLPNRRGLQRHLDRRLGPNGAADGLALLFIDLDDFKVVNDTLGHAAGDALLRVVGERLRAASRAADFVARVGGDEFAVVLEPTAATTTMELATTLAERILSALADPVGLGQRSVTTGCSIGIAEVATGSGVSAAVEDVLRNADVAMYLAKSRGKHCFESFTPTVHTEIQARLDLQRDLRSAVELDQLELDYQPVVDVDSGALLGLEALVRWQHPTLGRLAPAEFIALAEETGDIVAIGHWVLERACCDLRELRTSGRVAASTWVSVNVSPRQLRPDFVDRVRNTYTDADLPGANLVLEITESTFITDPGEALRVLIPLQREGIRVALDDFGTGYSSLHYLRDLPIDIIKLDRSFTTEVAEEGRPPVFEAIIGLGRSLGVEMIAEGIEQLEQLDRVRRLGGLGGQGFHIARPTSLAALTIETSPSPAPCGR